MDGFVLIFLVFCPILNFTNIQLRRVLINASYWNYLKNPSLGIYGSLWSSLFKSVPQISHLLCYLDPSKLSSIVCAQFCSVKPWSAHRLCSDMHLLMGVLGSFLFWLIFWWASSFIFNIYLFIWLYQVLDAAWELLVVACGNLVPWPGIEPRPPVLGIQSLSQWTTMEVSWAVSFSLFPSSPPQLW